MRKKILSVFLTLALLSTTFPAGVLAVEPGAEPDSGGIDLNSNNAEPSEPSEGESAENTPTEGKPGETSPASPADSETVEADYQIDPEDFPFTNDELFAQYVNDVFGIKDPYEISTFSTGDQSARNRLEDIEKDAYDLLLEKIQQVLDGSITSTVFTFDFSGSSNGLQEIADSFSPALDALLLDHPYEMFWFDKTIKDAWSLSGEDHTIVVSMKVAKDYARSNTAGTTDVNPSKITAAATAKANADEIVRDASGKTTLEKLLFFKDEICKRVKYNDAAASGSYTGGYGDPWQMIYVFDGDPDTNVVCEGYAKAFQYLCDQAFPNGPVQCYTVSGEMNGGTGAGGHMWNIVRIDNKSYLVDVTNCDEGSSGAPDWLFMAGDDGLEKGSPEKGYELYIPGTVTPNGNGISYSQEKTISYLYDEEEQLYWTNKAILTLADEDYYKEPFIRYLDVPEALYVGQEIEIKPTPYNTDPSKTYTYSVRPLNSWPSNVASDDDGTIKGTPGTVKNQKTNLVVSLLEDGKVVFNYLLILPEVKEAPVATTVKIFKNNRETTEDTLKTGQSATYTAKVYDQYNKEMKGQKISWQSRSDEDLTVNANEDGSSVTVRVLPTSGEVCQVTAYASDKVGSGPSAYVDITVSKLPSYTLTNVPGNQTLTYGDTYTPSSKPATNPAGGTIKYESDNPAVATVNENTGVVTATGVGTATITVKAVGTDDRAENSATYTVTVSKADITNITTAAPTATIKANDEKNKADKLKDAIILPETVTVAYGQDKTATLPVAWTASDSNTYNAKGGTYTWTGTPTVGENFNTTDKNLTATLTVTPVKVTTLALNPNKNTIKTTDSAALVLPTATLNVTCDPADVSISDITVNAWKNGDADFTLEALKTEAANLTADKELTLTPVYNALPEWATLEASAPTFKLTLTSHTVLTDAMVEGIPAQTYDGNAKTPVVTVKDGEKTLVKDTDYTVTYSDNVNAGTATATITGKGDYSGTINKTFKINPKQLADSMIANIPAQTLTDGKAEPDVVVTDNEKTLVKDTDYEVAYRNNTTVGTGTVTITGKGNYTDTASKTFTIQDTVQKSFTVDDIADQTYTGNEIKPDVVVKNGDTVLTKDTDYTITYSNNTNAGTATAIIAGQGDYSGTISKTFTINPKPLANSMIADIPAQTYDGSAKTPTVTVMGDTKKLVEGTDYTVSYSDNTAVGTNATVTITGKGNYSGTASKTFTIQNTVQKSFTVDNIADQTYTGNEIKPDVVVKDGDTVLTKDTDYTITYSNNTNAGTATAIITGKGDYSGTISKTFTISSKPLANNMIADIPAQTLTDGKAEPVIVVMDGDKTLELNKDYKVSYNNNTVVGTSATVIIEGMGNYSGTASKNFTITDSTTPEQKSFTVANIDNQKYTGSAIIPTVVVRDGSKTLELDKDYTVTYSNNTAVGTATATITGIGDYAAAQPVTKSFQIVANDFTVADISEQKYAGSAITPDIVVKDGDKILVKDTDYTVTYENNTNVGTATVTITGMGVYAGKVETKTFQIVANTFTVDNINDQKYTGSEIRPTVTVKDGNTTLTEGTHYTVTYSNNTSIGTATVTITGIGAYAGKVEIKAFQIIANTFRVDNIGNHVYTGNEIKPKVTVWDGKILLTEGTDYEVAYSNNINVGTATITITGKGAYEGVSDTKTFEITAPANPVLNITVVGDEGDTLAARREDNTIKVTGLGNKGAVNVSLTLMKGLTQETNGNTITVKSGNTTIATYTIDVSGVTAKIEGITITEGTNPSPVIDETKIPAEDKEEVTESANSTKADGLLASAAEALQTIANQEKTEGVTEVKVETSVKVEVKSYVKDETSKTPKTFKLDVKPQYTITIKRSDNTEVKQETKDIDNEHIKAPVTVSVKLPSNFPTTNLFARHFNSNGSVKEILKVTVKDGIASWQQSSFSEVELFQSNPVTATFPGFGSYEYNVDDIGQKLPEPEKRDGYTFDGWQIDNTGTVYTTVTEEFLKDAADKTLTAKFTKNETPVTPPDNPNPSTPGENTGSSSNSTSGTSSPALKPLPDRNHGTTTPANPTTPSNPDDTQSSFTDVPANHWAAGAIDWVNTQGLMNGISSTKFAPNNQTTRQQLWMILARLNGTRPANMAEARTWAMNNGISDGTNAVQNMSRQQMVTFLYRYAQQKGYQLTGSADLSSYSDSSAVAGYAREALAWAVANGIVNGTSQTTLSPTGTATRAQFATILQRFYNSVVNQ